MFFVGSSTPWFKHCIALGKQAIPYNKLYNQNPSFKSLSFEWQRCTQV